MKFFLKTIFIILLVCMFLVQISFWYELNKKDEKILKIFYFKIDKIYNKKPERLKKFYITLKKIRPKYKYKKNKSRFYFLTWELEKYLEKKLNIKKKYNNFWWKKINDNLKKNNNLVNPKNIKKIANEQDEEIKKIEKQLKKNWKKKTKKIIKILKNNFKINKKRYNKNIFKTTKKNGVLVKYLKIEKKYIPKNTPKNLIPEIKTNFLVKKILDNNKIKIKYYESFKIFEITGIEDYFCDNNNLNNFLKNNLENKNIFLDNIKKKNNNSFKAEFYINWKKLYKILIEKNVCLKVWNFK